MAGVINATGQLHGPSWASAPLADAAVERVLLLSKDYATVAGADDPGEQSVDAIEICKRLTGAQAAALFHSRAGALSLLFSSLQPESVVVVARGDVGDVDPGCRLVDLSQAAGIRLHEVGAAGSVTTGDYSQALGEQGGEQGGVVLRLAPEDHRVVGGAPRPTTSELATAVHSQGALIIEDLAGASLVDLPSIDGIVGPSAAAALDQGANLVLVRGDGLIGGPECCLVLGDQALVDQLISAPLATTQRPRAATSAALAATLGLLEDAERAALKIPTLSLLSAPIENLRTRAQRLAPQIAKSPWVEQAEATDLPAESTAVAGLPYEAASVAVAITPAGGSPHDLAQRLVSGPTAILARTDGDRLLIDLRTVFPRQDLQIVAGFVPDEPPEPPVDA